ncbi:MAG: ABC transporter permease [Anaerolineae bacterium]|nr:ABC transporter permease [Anaerolineae bacterium]
MIHLKFEKRLEQSRYSFVGVLVLSIVLALLFGALLLAYAGANPFVAYAEMAKSAFYSDWKETLVKATPLIFTGLSVTVAFRMRFWNIGAEGQLVVGGLAAAGAALFLPEIVTLPESPWVWIPIMMTASILAGALWALIPALLKAFLGVNEIITTLMFNYIAIFYYQFLYTDAWKDPAGRGFPGSARIPSFTKLPRFTGRVHLGIVIAVIAAILIWVIMSKTRQGYEFRLIGENPTAARYAGVNLFRNIILVMILSGGMAGLAGFSEISGVSFKLQQGLAVGYGFTGIIVAWLARLNPFGVILVALLLAGLLVGGDELQMSMQLPAAVGEVLQGMILLFVLGADIFTRYRLRVVQPPVALTSGD